MDEERRVEEDGRLVIYRRDGSRFYQMRARPEGTDRYVIRSLKTTDFIKAVSKARKEYHRMEAMIDAQMSIHNDKMDKIVDEYAEYIKDRSEKSLMSRHTAKNHMAAISAHLRGFFAGKILQRLGDDLYTEYQEWRTANAGKKLARVTLEMEMGAIKAILEYAASKKKIRANDLPKPKLVKGIANEVKRRPAFTEQEVRDLYEKMRGWPREVNHGVYRYARRLMVAYTELILFTGMRTNDLIDLQWKNISVFRKVVNGREGWYASIIVTGKPAINRPYREVTGQPHCVDVIENWKDGCKWTDPDDLVFCANRGVPWEPTVMFRKMLKDFGMLTDSLGHVRTPYSLRHTYATIRVIAGVPIHLLAQQMGTSIEKIEKHYNHAKLKEQVQHLSSGMVMNIRDEFDGLRLVINNEGVGSDNLLVKGADQVGPDDTIARG